MPKYVVSRQSTEDWEVTVEANNLDEVYGIIADGVEWTFLQSDDEIVEIEEIKGDK